MTSTSSPLRKRPSRLAECRRLDGLRDLGHPIDYVLAEIPPSAEVIEASNEHFWVEGMGNYQVCSNPEHRLRVERAVFEQDERGLKVVVKGANAPPEITKPGGGRDALEMDENAAH